MSTANPLEQLRRRMQSHATPAAFAALAEEHRRAGRLVEAIAVCRDGLERYPAYVSARVTLGRALLDSGDVGSAVTELEQAAAQAPDNLAAARALEAAHAARDAAPPPPSPPSDLPLHAADDDTSAIPAVVVGRALASGPDRPQEFGLDADWSIPDASPPAWGLDDAPVVAATPETTHDEGSATQALFAHTEAPTMFLTPQHLQGEEPAGIWPMPSPSFASGSAPDEAAGVVSWAVDPVEGTDATGMPDPVVSAIADPASVWDALTIEAAVVDRAASPTEAEPGPSQSDPDASSPQLAHTPEVAPMDESVAGVASADGDGSPFWTGVFGGEPEIETAPPFSAWGDQPAPPVPSTDRSPWAGEGFADQRDAWTVPDGPSASWALGDLQEAAGADSVPFQAVRADLGAPPAETTGPGESMDESTDGLSAEVAWAGSVKSALGEVFARAGHGESLEPAAHPSPAVRVAMADAAVEAAVEDAALRDDAPPPALASLQQMLDAVRARRAALFHDVDT